MPDLHNFLQCLADDFTPVRDAQGHLLGCIPRVPDNTELVFNSTRAAFELRIAGQVCVCVDINIQDPSTLEGFIPYDKAAVDISIPLTNDDIGESV